jgi:hypothetical protein
MYVKVNMKQMLQTKLLMAECSPKPMYLKYVDLPWKALAANTCPMTANEKETSRM